MTRVVSRLLAINPPGQIGKICKSCSLHGLSTLRIPSMREKQNIDTKNQLCSLRDIDPHTKTSTVQTDSQFLLKSSTGAS